MWGALCEQRRLSEEGGDATRIADLEEIIRAHDGYTLKHAPASSSEGLGIPVVYHRQPLATLSGGFGCASSSRRCCSVGRPRAPRRADQPPRHLVDPLAGKFLAAYKGCAVIISHDQRFLDNVATHILDLDYDTITAYPGNYSAFAPRSATCARKETDRPGRAAIAHKRAYVERFRYKASGLAGAEPAQADRKDRSRGARRDLTSRAVPFASRPSARAAAMC